MDIPEQYAVMPTIKQLYVKTKTSETFSGYKKKDVGKEFYNNLKIGNYEMAIHLGVELHLTGSYKDLLNILIEFYIDYCLLKNPQYSLFLADYLLRISKITSTLGKGEFKIKSINSQEIRNMIACIIIEIIELEKDNDELKKRIRDPRTLDNEKIKENTIDHSQNFFRELESIYLKEIRHALNECMYAIILF